MSQIHSCPVQKIEKRERCLVLLSGGLDSVTATYWAVKQGYRVEALFFDFSHTTKDRELECAMDVADRFKVRLHILKVPLSQKVLQDIMPLANLSIKETNATLNMTVFGSIVILCAIGASYASISQIGMIIIGLEADDVEMHLGLQPAFFQTFEKLISLWTGKEFKILTPFLEQDKSAVIKIGTELGVPFQCTWSCSASNEKHCGRCKDCLMRAKAFVRLRLKDPTEYEVVRL